LVEGGHEQRRPGDCKRPPGAGSCWGRHLPRLALSAMHRQ
jgi:hypothetical protein